MVLRVRSHRSKASRTMSLIADGWSVAPIERWEAEHMIRNWHYSRSVTNTATYCHGLIAPDWSHWGVALWIPPTKGAAQTVSDEWRGVLSLSRLVCLPGAPKLAASFLLGRSMKLIDRARWPVLLTYADTRLGHTGAIYRATNWSYLGPVESADTWVHTQTGEQRGRKRGPTTLRAADMIAAGYVKQPAMPKLKFVHYVGGRR